MDEELKVMAKALNLIGALEPAAGLRVLTWVASKLRERGEYGVMKTGEVIYQGPTRHAPFGDTADVDGGQI